MRIGQTLDLADRIIGLVPQLDADAAFGSAARAIAQAVAQAGAVPVPALEEGAASALVAQHEPGDGVHGAGRGFDAAVDADGVPRVDLGELLDRAFARAFSADDGAAALFVSEKELAEEKRLLEEELRSAVVREELRSARQVAGKCLDVSGFLAYDGSTKLEVKYSLDELSEVSRLVRISFETFKRVVQDHGLFAAFAADSAFGSCSCDGRRWVWVYNLDDLILGFEDGAAPERDIPPTVDEDEGGDAPARVIERMKEFNAKPFYGMLDDDFACHTDAFWYGFRKLMEFVNGLCKVDASDFAEYIHALNEQVSAEAGRLGTLMSEVQVEEWSDAFAEAADVGS